MSKNTLHIVRGLPGSGKSTVARRMLQDGTAQLHFEADMYFLNEAGEYKFDPRKIGRAHEWCYNKTTRALDQGKNVVVSNTFTQRWEAAPYIQYAADYGIDVVIHTCFDQWKNVHDVPEEVLRKMKERFESYTGDWVK